VLRAYEARLAHPMLDAEALRALGARSLREEVMGKCRPPCQH
jgi:hypothetical protein